MIREESAVRAAILDDSLVPDAADLLARLPVSIRRRRRRRVASAVIAVITVVAAITIPMFVIPRSAAVVSSTTRDPHALLAQSVREIDTGTTIVTIDTYTAGMQVGSVRIGDLTGGLWVNDIGATPAADLADLRNGSSPVVVRGRAGFLTTGRTGVAPPEIAWEYAPGGWAFVSGCTDGQACARTTSEMVSLASAVRFDRATPIGVPVAVGYLPYGLGLDSADRVFPSEFFNDDPSQPFGVSFSFLEPGTNAHGSIMVELVVRPTAAEWSRPSSNPDANALPNGTVAGHRVFWSDPDTYPISDRYRVFLTLGTCAAEVTAFPNVGIAASASHDEIVKIVEGLRLADCSDHSTWFAGTTAIPGGGDTTVDQHMPTFSTSSMVIPKSPRLDARKTLHADAVAFDVDSGKCQRSL